MRSIDQIKNIDKEIEFYEQRIKDLKAEIKALNLLVHKYSMPQALQAIQYTGMPTGSRVDIDFEAICERILKCQNQIEDIKEIIAEKKAARNSILELLKNFEGLSYKVAYMRIAEGKSIKVIAEELGYSDQYIKNLAWGINKVVNKG